MRSFEADLLGRLLSFVAERFPHSLAAAAEAFGRAGVAAVDDSDPAAVEALRARATAELRRSLAAAPDGLPETTPGVSPAARLAQAADELVSACDGALRREALRASLTDEERRELLQ